MEGSYKEYEQSKLEIDINAAKWFGQELIDSSYFGSCKGYLLKMESEYRQALRTIIGYTDYYGRYIDGYLDAPFWSSAEEALIHCMKDYKEAALRHPKNTFYPAVVDAADTILEYLTAGLPV